MAVGSNLSQVDLRGWRLPRAPNPLNRGALAWPYHNALKSLRDLGAGEGIRTLDPNLGKVVSNVCSWLLGLVAV